jgi:hypothetical protein
MPSDPRGDRSTAGEESWGASSGADPVSPELVLVAPPDEARRARELLPAPPASEQNRLHSQARARPAQPEPEHPPQVPRRRRWVRRTVLVGALLLVVVTGVTVGLAGSRDTKGKRTAEPTIKPVRHQSSTNTSSAPTTTVQKRHAKTTPRRSRPASHPNSQAPARTSEKKKKKTPSKKQTSTRSSPPARRAPTGFVPARTWSWEPQTRTRRYVFTLARNGRRVIAARTAKPRFVLPQRFQFAAGRYRWRVVALTTKPGARRKVVVDSKFRLSAAGAAAANG